MGATKELEKEAEKRLVSILLSNPEEVPKTLEEIEIDDIQEPSLKLLYSTIVELSRRGDVVSVISVAEDLDSRGLISQVGGLTRLYKMNKSSALYLIDAPISVYRRVVKNFSNKVAVLESFESGIEDLDDDSSLGLSEVVSDVQSKLSEVLVSTSDRSTVSTTNDLYVEFLKRIEEREKKRIENEGSGGLQGIPTSLPSLNEYTTGWLGGQLITIGAQTGIGKSVLAVNSAIAAGSAGASVLFFSLEMSRSEIEDRMVSSVTGIPMQALKQGDVKNHDTLKKGLEEIKDMKITIDGEPNLTTDSIRARSLKHAQSPDGVDLIIIDYLQLITASSKSDNRQQQVAEMSRQIKLLAKEMNVPIIIVVQLVRPSGEDADQKPNLYQIRESGAIAADSDIVILLHRPRSDDETTPVTQVLLEKNRNGPTNRTILCHSNLSCSSFREINRREDIAYDEDEMRDFEAEASNNPVSSIEDIDYLDPDILEDGEDF